MWYCGRFSCCSSGGIARDRLICRKTIEWPGILWYAHTMKRRMKKETKVPPAHQLPDAYYRDINLDLIGSIIHIAQIAQGKKLVDVQTDLNNELVKFTEAVSTEDREKKYPDVSSVDRASALVACAAALFFLRGGGSVVELIHDLNKKVREWGG